MFEINRKKNKYKAQYMTDTYKPKLKERPIPSLKETQKSFIKFIRPFLDNKSDTEFHEVLINEFISQEGNILQKKLIDLSRLIVSWYHDLVLEDFYLKNRKPIPFYSNYFIVYDINFCDQIDAFAKIIISCIFLKRMIKDDKISELTTKDYSQYFYLFHSVRSPRSIFSNKDFINTKCLNIENIIENGLKENSQPSSFNLQSQQITNQIFKPRDWLNVYDYNENRFAIVIYKNIFWLVETSLDYDNLSDNILYITSLDISEKKDNFIGILTGAERGAWGECRHSFLQMHPKNKEFIYYIERSMLIFCLYDSIYDRLNDTKELFNILWSNELQNRFFDKIMQIVIFKDGKICLNMDKSVVDISVALEFLKFIKTLNENSDITKTGKKQIFNKFANNQNKKHISNNPLKNMGNELIVNGITNNNNHNFNLSLSQINRSPSFSHIIAGYNESENANDYNTYFENFSYKPIKLNYILDENIKSQIKKTEDQFTKTITNNYNAEVFLFKDYGKYLFEKKGVDMNSFIQLAILAAHYRVYGKIVASRQFLCGRNFKFGFVDFVRTTIKESVNFIVSLNELRIPRDLKVKLGQDFFKANKNNLRDVINGKSIDVHFTGLKWIACNKSIGSNKNTIKIKNSEKDNKAQKSQGVFSGEEITNFPDSENTIESEFLNKIINDEFYKKSCDWIIETYPILNENVQMCVQGYSNEIDGISITYIAKKDSINFNIVSANNPTKFVETLEEILYEMKDLFLEKGREHKPKF